MRLIGIVVAVLFWVLASPVLAQTQGNAVGDLVSKCGTNVPIFGTGSAGTNAALSCSGTTQPGQGGTGVASPTTNDIYKGAGSSPMVPSALVDDGTKVSSSEPVDLTNTALVTEIPNAGTTGTTLNKLAKLTGAPSTVVILTTADTTGVAGVVVGGAGTTGNALVARQGQASCVFDGATTAGDYVQASTSVAGDCTDATATYPTTGQILGRVLSTNGSGGTYALTLFSPEIRGGSGGGGGGTVTSVAIKGAGGLTTSGSCTITSAGTCVLYTPGGFLNKFRNPGFDIAQRGTSGSVSAGTTAYTLDGWQISATGAAAAWSRQTNNDVAGNELTINCATGLTALTVQQRIESYLAWQLRAAQNTNVAPITVQFGIVNRSGATITPQLATQYPNATDNFSAVTTDLVATNLQSIPNNSYANVAYTFTPANNIDAGYQIQLLFGGACNAASGSISIFWTDVRATPGVAAGLNGNPPPPELHPVAYEMALCQRYYQSYLSATNFIQVQGYQSAGGSISNNMVIPTMRASPNATIVGTWTNVNTSGLNILTSPGIVLLYIIATATGSAAAANPANGGFTLSAEL